MIKKSIQFIKSKKEIIIPLFIILAVYVALFFLGMGCPIKYFTGISCAGCGMTRAWLSVFKGNFYEAFRYHPLFLLVIPTALWILFKGKMSQKLYKAGLFFVVFIFLIVYVVRLFYPEDMVVTFDPRSGVFFRLIKWIK